ncbi:MAG: bifunctional hydroxymethylpyrimidine kinase/phosphomethylpyrimidine kinase [Promethearchaeota archaeon]
MIEARQTMGRSHVALTIAGSDSSGGAGIAADLKTFAALGVHGACAVTVITAQNTVKINGMMDATSEMVEEQIDAVALDMGINAAKTGLLPRKDIVGVVIEKLDQYGFPLVVDPIIWAGVGDRLITEESEKAIIEELIPRATVLTPNIIEAEAILGKRIEEISDLEKAAKELANKGPEAVVIKGGHLPSENIVDVLYWKGRIKTYSKPRIGFKNVHGSGCAFSAGITAFLAKGHQIDEAVDNAEEFIHTAFSFPVGIGRGAPIINPLATIQPMEERFEVLNNLHLAIKDISNTPRFSELVPETRADILMALPNARSEDEVAAIDGRVTIIDGRPVAVGFPWFGVSARASTILVMIKHNPNYRASVIIRYSEKIINACKAMGLIVSDFDRRDKPNDIKTEEQLMAWGINDAVRKTGQVPEVIWDRGDIGKEPLIWIFAPSGLEAVKKSLDLLRRM